jgi:hypothetical protein
VGDIMSESMGGIISECPGDFIGIGRDWTGSISLIQFNNTNGPNY